MWWFICGGVYVVVYRWWCICCVVYVVVSRWWYLCGCVCVVVFYVVVSVLVPMWYQ